MCIEAGTLCKVQGMSYWSRHKQRLTVMSIIMLPALLVLRKSTLVYQISVQQNNTCAERVFSKLVRPIHRHVENTLRLNSTHVSSIVSMEIVLPWPGKPYKFACPVDPVAEACANPDCFVPEFGMQTAITSFLFDCPDCLYVDIGCNLGMFAAQAAALGASVDCYEATPGYVDIIRATRELSKGKDRWRVHNLAILRDNASDNCTMQFNTADADCSGNSFANPWKVNAASVRLVLFSRRVKLLRIEVDNRVGSILPSVVKMIKEKETVIETMILNIVNRSSFDVVCHTSPALYRQEAMTSLRLLHEYGYEVFHVPQQVQQDGKQNVEGTLSMFAVRGMPKIEKLMWDTASDDYAMLFNQAGGVHIFATRVQLAEPAWHHGWDLGFAKSNEEKKLWAGKAEYYMHLNQGNPALKKPITNVLDNYTIEKHYVVDIVPLWPGKPYKLACPRGSSPKACQMLNHVHGTKSTCHDPERQTEEVINSFLLNCNRCLYIDIGCNVGYFAAQAVALGATVECYEPTTHYTDAVKVTRKLNNVEASFRIHNVAVVADKKHITEQEFTVAFQPCGVAAEHPQRWVVPTMQIKDILFGKSVKLLKIDIDSLEGALLHTILKMLERHETDIETIVIEIGDDRGPTAWMNSTKPSSTTPRGGNVDDFRMLQVKHGYDVYRINVHVAREIFDWRGVNVNHHMSPLERGVSPLFAIRNMRKLEKVEHGLRDYTRLVRFGVSLLFTRERFATQKSAC